MLVYAPALVRPRATVRAPRAVVARARAGPDKAPPKKPDRPPPPAVRIDFGDGECVSVRLESQPDFALMLHSVRAAGVRRRAANGFPTNDAPLLRRLRDVDAEQEYMVWPRPPPPDEGRRL